MSVRTLRYNTMNQHFTKSALASTDRDALAFLEAAQIYNTNQQKAIIRLVRELKRAGLWAKMKAIYPFMGGTASSHKWNLKDPRDADAAFRLTFSGGWTHSANGALPNGTTGYANTFFIPNNNLVLFNSHLSYYCRTQTTNAGQFCGVTSNGPSYNAREVFILGGQSSNQSFVHPYGNPATSYAITTAYADSRGHWIGRRTDGTAASCSIIRNGTVVASASTNSTGGALNIFPVYLAARHDRTGAAPYAFGFSNAQCAFATIGDGLTDSDATNLYNIVDLYQKRLGRAV